MLKVNQLQPAAASLKKLEKLATQIVIIQGVPNLLDDVSSLLLAYGLHVDLCQGVAKYGEEDIGFLVMLAFLEREVAID